MALKIKGVETFGKKDGLGFNPSDLVPRFAKFTGRKDRTEAQIDAMVKSLLQHGQEQNFLYRKDQFTGEPIPVTGHTRILAGDKINRCRMVGANGAQYSLKNPFILYGTFRAMNELDAVIHTFVENDDATRTPLNDVDYALLISTLSETFALKDADIAAKLGKDAGWVSLHRVVLELDPDTQEALRNGSLKFNAAVGPVAKIEPKERKRVITRAQEKNKGRATAPGITRAAKELGVKTSAPLANTTADLKRVLRGQMAETEPGPLRDVYSGILDYLSGAETEAGLQSKCESLREALSAVPV